MRIGENVAFADEHTSGHEFVGKVIALGSNFLSAGEEQATLNSRPALYLVLKAEDKVVSPFTVSCGECRYVRASSFLDR